MDRTKAKDLSVSRGTSSELPSDVISRNTCGSIRWLDVWQGRNASRGTLPMDSLNYKQKINLIVAKK